MNRKRIAREWLWFVGTLAFAIVLTSYASARRIPLPGGEPITAILFVTFVWYLIVLIVRVTIWAIRTAYKSVD